MENKEILIELKNAVAIIYLHRPQVYNSFNRTMSLELQKALDQCEANQDLRAVIITGYGKAFCAGQDLSEATSVDGPTIETIINEHYNPIVRRIHNLSKPVVAVVNGVAAGAGANLALCCDIILASEEAVFIQAFSKIGLIPDTGGTYFLPRLIGLQRAMALCMTADKVTASQAMQMGLVYQTYPTDQLQEMALSFANQLAAMPTQALILTKKALRNSFSNSLDEQLNLELKLQIQAAATEDFKEGIEAFLQKRKPNFKGK